MAGRPIDCDERQDKRVAIDNAIKSLRRKGLRITRKRIADELGITVQALYGKSFIASYLNSLNVIEDERKYAGCINGVTWFQDRDIWADGSAEPVAGMIVFFDWDDENGQDGQSDHTGIVEKVEDGIVYTVEGNSGDSVREKQYPVGYYEILGYGIPAY